MSADSGIILEISPRLSPWVLKAKFESSYSNVYFMSLCNVMVRMKTCMRFSLLGTYDVKGRGAEWQEQLWSLKDLGLDPASGFHVALSPLHSYLAVLSIRFLFCDPPQRVRRGLRKRMPEPHST